MCIRNLNTVRLSVGQPTFEWTHDALPIRSDFCRWERLELRRLSSYRIVEAFTVWPAGMKLAWTPDAVEHRGDDCRWWWDIMDGLNDGVEDEGPIGENGRTHAATAFDGPAGIVLWIGEDDDASIPPLAPLAGIVSEVRRNRDGALVASSAGHSFVMIDARLMITQDRCECKGRTRARKDHIRCSK